MAKKPKAGNGAGKVGAGEVTVTKNHNVKSRGLILAEIGAEFRQINAERARQNDRAGTQRKRLRELDVNPQAFLLTLRLADLEDGAARDSWMDAFHEAWSALGIGGQLDWIAAAGNDEAQPHELADT